MIKKVSKIKTLIQIDPNLVFRSQFWTRWISRCLSCLCLHKISVSHHQPPTTHATRFNHLQHQPSTVRDIYFELMVSALHFLPAENIARYKHSKLRHFSAEVFPRFRHNADVIQLGLSLRPRGSNFNAKQRATEEIRHFNFPHSHSQQGESRSVRRDGGDKVA